MHYQRANEILPENLVGLVQKYIGGGYVYIPRKQGNGKNWGEPSRTKEELRRRGKKMFTKYRQGMGVKSLAEQYFLSEKSIQRIVLQEKKTFQEKKILQETENQDDIPDWRDALPFSRFWVVSKVYGRQTP